MFECGDKSSLMSESVTEIRINIHPVGEKPDNMMHTRSLGRYVWQPFTKSLQGWIRSSALKMKS
jgi:hypothetical protein